MRRAAARSGAVLLVTGLLLAARGVASAQEDTLVLEGSGGFVPVEDATTFRLSGIRGSVSLRAAKPGELRYEARALADRRQECSVSLWRRGRALSLEYPSGREPEPLLLEIAVPPQLYVNLELADGRVAAGGIHGAMELHGTRVEADLRDVRGILALDLTESRVLVDGATELQFEGRQVEADLRRVQGRAVVRNETGRVHLSEVRGDAEVDADETDLDVEAVYGGVRIDARGGSVALRRSNRGAELDLEDAPLTLEQMAGRIVVESDRDVEFRDLQAHLQINNFSGAIRGSGNKGSTAVVTARAQVALEKLEGPTTVEGDGLTVRLAASQGQLRVRTTGSEIAIEDAQGPIEVENDYGDVSIRGAGDAIKVSNAAGNVVLEEIKGPLELRADSERVEVRWAEVAGADQVVANEGGELSVTLPQRAVCRVQAESEFGHVVSEHPGVQVSDDERSASGLLGLPDSPLIQLRSGGDVFIALAR